MYRLGMRFLNRTAVVVVPKQRYLDWLRTADPTATEITIEQVQREPTIYLLPECDNDGEASGYLRDMCEEIFEHELDSWYRDTIGWPDDLRFSNFTEWFDYTLHSVVIDLDDRRLKTEEL